MSLKRVWSSKAVFVTGMAPVLFLAAACNFTPSSSGDAAADGDEIVAPRVDDSPDVVESAEPESDPAESAESDSADSEPAESAKPGSGSVPEPTGSAKPKPDPEPAESAQPKPEPVKPKPAEPAKPKPAPAEPAKPKPAPAQPAKGVEQEVVRLTNIARANNGCPALSVDAKLMAAAQAHSKDMADNNYFSHTGLNGSEFGDRVRRQGYAIGLGAENIARGQRTPKEVVDGWLNSPGHRANILNCRLTEIGVGFHDFTWTQVFANPA